MLQWIYVLLLIVVAWTKFSWTLWWSYWISFLNWFCFNWYTVCIWSGAVMFLFEGGFGNVLHTGDCRLTPEYLQRLPEKYLGKKGKKPRCQLDYVFLDCTFGKYYQSVPSKHSAIQQVLLLGSSYTCYSSVCLLLFYSQGLLFLKIMLKMEYSSLLFKIQD